MFQPNEVVMFILGIGVLIYTIINKAEIKKITHWKYLLSGFYALLGGWFFTNIEALWASTFFNFLEHFFYTLSIILTGIWIINKCRNGEDRV